MPRKGQSAAVIPQRAGSGLSAGEGMMGMAHGRSWGLGGGETPPGFTQSG